MDNILNCAEAFRRNSEPVIIGLFSHIIALKIPTPNAPSTLMVFSSKPRTITIHEKA